MTDRDAILDMWMSGKSQSEIQSTLGTVTPWRVRNVIYVARRAGDKRAVLHGVGPKQSPWTDEKVQLLRTLNEAGHTRAHIAAVLGLGRNAIIGKAYRLGLTTPSPTGQAGGRARAVQLRAERKARLEARKVRCPRFVKQSLITGEWFKVQPKALKPKKTEWRDPPEPPEVRRLTLMQLEADDCRFPLGDPAKPGFSFCGCKRLSLWPYCEYHQSITRVAGTHL